VVVAGLSPSHRGGTGTPLVLVHGFMDTWRTWELVLPALERRHDVLAPTLPGHAGGPPLATRAGLAALADAVERAMDAAPFETAHLAGNSLGGFVALELAARGRARSVVALAPAGGGPLDETVALQRSLLGALRALAPNADAIVATEAGRRQATGYAVESFEHIPPDLIAHQLAAAAAVDPALLDRAACERWDLDAVRIECPVRIVWGTADRLLPWPSAAARFREQLPHADWLVLDGVGHCPQLDVPLETAQLVLGVTAG
jgi:pimeloyl-ACP methyl ester carboxylesterase